MQSLKDTINAMLRKYGIDNAVAQNKALMDWERVVGARVAKIAVPEKVEHGIIIVKVTSPTWRQELFFKKKEIIDRLNQEIGKKVIRDIRFI